MYIGYWTLNKYYYYYIDSVYVGMYCGLSESELCVFGKLCPIGFLVVCECSSVLLQSSVMSFVDCGDDGWWSDDCVFSCLRCPVVQCVRHRGDIW